MARLKILFAVSVNIACLLYTSELGVYSSERKKVATLTIRGNVTPRMKSTEELYPVDAGGGLRLSTTLNAFSYIRPGQQVQLSLIHIWSKLSTSPLRLSDGSRLAW